MDVEILRNWFASHWEVDDAARSFYSRFRLPSGKPLEPEQQQEYTLNASALQSVIRLMNDVKMKRAVMQGSKIRWEEMAGAISFFQKGVRAQSAAFGKPLQEESEGLPRKQLHKPDKQKVR